MIEYTAGTDAAKKNVLIVDDHCVVRRGVTELLNQQPDLCVCGAVASAEQALEVAGHEPLDLAIIDISLGQIDGIRLTSMLKQKYPRLVILILSMHDEHVYGPRAQRAGASGFVTKQQAGETLLDAIRQVLNGQLYFHPGT
ncbi:MAG: response regulator transcription factor [Sedimentisphaerales bacterium]|nr:response regulator transcription factor [Sedimentisphaerales bacterium]